MVRYHHIALLESLEYADRQGCINFDEKVTLYIWYHFADIKVVYLLYIIDFVPIDHLYPHGTFGICYIFNFIIKQTNMLRYLWFWSNFLLSPLTFFLSFKIKNLDSEKTQYVYFLELFLFLLPLFLLQSRRVLENLQPKFKTHFSINFLAPFKL